MPGIDREVLRLDVVTRLYRWKKGEGGRDGGEGCREDVGARHREENGNAAGGEEEGQAR